MSEINIRIKGAVIIDDCLINMIEEVIKDETVVIYVKNLKWRWWRFWHPKYLINPKRIKI